MFRAHDRGEDRLAQQLHPGAAQSREPLACAIIAPTSFFDARQVDLVPYDDPRSDGGRRAAIARRRMIRLARIGDDQRQVRTFDCGQRALDAELFHRVAIAAIGGAMTCSGCRESRCCCESHRGGSRHRLTIAIFAAS